MSANELVDMISQKVPASVQIEELKNTFPHGIVRGDVFTIGSLDGEAGKSLKNRYKSKITIFYEGIRL